MISQTLSDKLLELRLSAIRDGLQEQAANPQYTELSFEERLLLLVELECFHRLESRTKRRIQAAHFPIRSTIEDLDFSPERGLDRRQILELAQCTWIDKARNLIVSGATGTGKTFLACAFGTAACKLGLSVRYFHTARLIHALSSARKEDTYFDFLKSLAKVELLVLDDWMRDSISLPAAQDLLELFDDRFNCSATILVSQVPISDWHARFPDPTLADAILNRTIHNAYRVPLAGDSQRKLRGFRSMPHA